MERAFWLAWSQIDGVGAVLLRRLHLHFGTLAAAWEASPHALAAIDGLGESSATAIAAQRSACEPLELLDRHLQTNPHFWTPADSDYPHLLLEMPDPPPVLYYRGRVESRENRGQIPTIALVGTRRPSDYGRRWTQKLTTALVHAGYTIVSGLAEGVDTVAHQSCLQAGGRTIAALGTGVDVVYPWSNRRLSQQIAETGLLVSEYPAGTQPDRVNFPRRNRIIAGLCRATLVLEAPRKSGALITARLANEYGREVYVLPGSLDNDRCLGCLELLNQGAHLILGIDPLLEFLGDLPTLDPLPAVQRSLFDSPSAVPEPITLDPPLAHVLQVISAEPVSLDRIVEQANLATELVSSALLQLELMGLVAQLPGMQYRKVG